MYIFYPTEKDTDCECKPLPNLWSLHGVESVYIRRFSGPYFPAFGLNTERYGYSVRMLENTGQKHSEYGHFPHSVGSLVLL